MICSFCHSWCSSNLRLPLTFCQWLSCGGESEAFQPLPPVSKMKRYPWKRQTLNHEQANEPSTKPSQPPNLSEPSQTWPYHHSHSIAHRYVMIRIDTPHRDFETWLGVACVAQCCGPCAPCAPCALPGTKSCSWRQVAVVETLEFLETLETWRVERRFCPRCSREKKRPGKFTDSSHSDQTPILNYVYYVELCWIVESFESNILPTSAFFV